MSDPTRYQGRSMTATGRFRVYFNAHYYAPLVWSVVLITTVEGVDVPAWEVAVQSVAFDGPCTTVYEPKPTPDDVDGKPSAWIDVAGTLTVSETGEATIKNSSNQ